VRNRDTRMAVSDVPRLGDRSRIRRDVFLSWLCLLICSSAALILKPGHVAYSPALRSPC
jgi:hypothetical protein